MGRTRIKFCGVTSVEDALAAVSAGADAIGMAMYAGSRRAISVQMAQRIVNALPPFVTAVALFVDETPQRIREIAQELHIGHVQLHGHETPQQAAQLEGLAIIKAIKVDARFAQTAALWRGAALPALRGVLLESGGTAAPGGTGKANDWAAVMRHRDSGNLDGIGAIIAAGGLDPANVGDVVRMLRPHAVDVASGVEDAPGRKSVEKMRAFVSAVRGADRAIGE